MGLLNMDGAENRIAEERGGEKEQKEVKIERALLTNKVTTFFFLE